MIGVVNPIIYALGDDPFRPESPGGQMRCPSCGQHTPDDWKPWFVTATEGGITHGVTVEGKDGYTRTITLEWMRCANKAECGEVVIRMHEMYRVVVGGLPEARVDTSMVRPRAARRPVPPQVPEPFRTDFVEATLILDDSPRMSAVLSRSILADLLERYAGLDAYHLPERIDAFMADTTRPFEVRKNLHHLREIANFGAHTQKDKSDQTKPIDVTRDEAEWTLLIVERLFDYFIVTPAKDKEMREAFDAKIDAADRKPIPPLPDEPDVEDGS